MAKSKWDVLDMPTRLPEIEQLARDGYRDEDIYNTLGISRQTFYTWQTKFPEFKEALRKGKEVVDAEIENKLLDNARGYDYWEVTQELQPVRDEGGRIKKDDYGKPVEELVTTKRVLKHVKADTTAQIFWLKNRKPDAWRDKNHIEHGGNVNMQFIDDLGE